MNLYQSIFKRLIDILLSFFGLLVLSPVLLFVSMLILFFMGRPIFFIQPRPGKKEVIFNMIKFRTMTNSKDQKGNFLSDEKRLTKLGKFLRSTSLDELPELINVLIGQMSLVGPRPLLVEYLSYYDSTQKLRHDVRPGITGLAQINGRNSLTWKDKLQFDVDYVNNISLWGDIKILIYTVLKVIKRDDIQYNDQVGPELFRGTDESKE